MDEKIFKGGVESGGLTTTNEIKFLICHIIHNVDMPLSFMDLNHILQSCAVVNYFEYSDALNKLIKLNHIVVDNDDKLLLTEIGHSAAVVFERNLPKSIREKTIKEAIKYTERKKAEKTNFVKIKKLDEGYSITITISDLGSDLMSLTLFMPTEHYCEFIKENFYKSPTSAYLKILQAFSDEKK